MLFAAWATQARPGAMPRLQLAMLALGLTGVVFGGRGKRAGTARTKRTSASEGSGGTREPGEERVSGEHEP